MNIIEKLNWRYAVKKFDTNKTLTNEQINALSESVRLSASSRGLQPYRLIWVNSKDVREKLLPYSMKQTKVVEASHLLVFAIETPLEQKHIDDFVERTAKIRNQSIDDLASFKQGLDKMLKSKTNEELFQWSARQVYIALGTLLTAAAVMDIDACPMEGFAKDKYDEVLGLNEKGLKSLVIVTLGYRDSEDSYQFKQKVRKSENELFIEI